MQGKICAEAVNRDFPENETSDYLELELSYNERLKIPMPVYLACAEWCAGWSR